MGSELEQGGSDCGCVILGVKRGKQKSVTKYEEAKRLARSEEGIYRQIDLDDHFTLELALESIADRVMKSLTA